MPASKPAIKTKQKLLESWIKEWKNILPAISSWLKLLALIVLVAATFIIIAMCLTPSTNKYFSLYPFMLLGLLLIIIIGIFIDRQKERKFKAGLEVVRTENNNLKIEQKTISAKETDGQINFSDNRIGFKIYSSIKQGWQKPQFLTYKQLLINLGMSKNDEEDDSIYERALIANPYADMYLKSENIIFQFGNNIEIEFLENSSSQAIEEYLARVKKYFKESEDKEISEEDIQKRKKTIIPGRY